MLMKTLAEGSTKDIQYHAKLVVVLEIKYFLSLRKRETHQLRLYPILSCYISNYGSHNCCWTTQSNNCFIWNSTAFTVKAANKLAQSNFLEPVLNW